MSRIRSALSFIFTLLRRGLLILAMAALAGAALAAVQKTLLDTYAARPVGPPPLDDRAAATLSLLSEVSARLTAADFTHGAIGYVGRTVLPGDQAAVTSPTFPELAAFALAPVVLDARQTLNPKCPWILANFATRPELDRFLRERPFVIALDLTDRAPGLALLQHKPPQTAPASAAGSAAAPATNPQTQPEGK